jgi:hypothetical protein
MQGEKEIGHLDTSSLIIIDEITIAIEKRIEEEPIKIDYCKVEVHSLYASY